MITIVFKTFCILCGAFGMYALQVLLFWVYGGEEDSPQLNLISILFSVSRSIVLIICAIAAWYAPHVSVWCAWLALILFAIGGVLAGIPFHGLSKKLFTDLVPQYYYTVVMHLIVALSLSFLYTKMVH